MVVAAGCVGGDPASPCDLDDPPGRPLTDEEAAALPKPRGGPEHPNVLFVGVDDLRADLGATGRSQVITPYLDQLAAEGLVFERAYVQQALCSPSRTSLLTGLRPGNSGIRDQGTHFRESVADVVTLPQLFAQHGYHTEWWGKIFHTKLLDPPSWTRQGERLEPRDNWRSYASDEAKRLAEANEGRGPAYERVDVPDDAYPDGKVALAAVQALERLAGGQTPFFLAVGFYKPHLPFNAPARYWDLYDREAISPPEPDSPPVGAPPAALGNWGELRSYHGMPSEGPVDAEVARDLIHGYRASVSYIDAQIGKLLDALVELGLADDTIVVVWGDHGWKLGEYGAWAKRSNFELDARAPLLMRVPWASARGESTSSLVEFVDIYPTLADLAGLPLPGHLDGQSFSPLLEDPQRSWKDAALSEMVRGKLLGRSLRTQRYRFTIWQENDERGSVVARELYDHSGSTPLAVANLATQPQCLQTVSQLGSRLESVWQGAHGPDAPSL